MKKLLAFSLSAAMLLVPTVSFANMIQEGAVKKTEAKQQEIIFQQEEITDSQEIIKKGKKLTEEEIKKEGIQVKSSDPKEKIKLDVYRLNQKLKTVRNPDGTITNSYVERTVTVITPQAVMSDQDSDSTASVQANWSMYYNSNSSGYDTYVSVYQYDLKLIKLDSNTVLNGGFTMYSRTGGNIYGGGRTPVGDVIKTKAISSPSFGSTNSFAVTTPNVCISDGVGVQAGYAYVPLKRSTTGSTWTFSTGIGKGNTTW